jgi:uncharacterized flavoprotein (TIGR03862 family)
MPSAAIRPRVAVIGGGPAGLMAAEVMAAGGIGVDVYDAMPSVGRKFLLAGIGGLNITHSEPFDTFCHRFGAREAKVREWLRDFDADALRAWVHGLGIETFVGSSGRVFPAEMKAAPLLRAWLHRLRETGVVFHRRHRWQGWDTNGALRFAAAQGEVAVAADAVVLALGGGSWARLGSDGAWVPWLTGRGIAVAPLRPANCGFDLAWSDAFRERHAGEPLKGVRAACVDADGTRHERPGECVVSASGLEGGLVYALSAWLRDRLERDGEAWLELDLLPARSAGALADALARPRGKDSLGNHWRKRAGLEGVKAGLVREVLPREDWEDGARVAATAKSLRLRLLATRPLDEAISSAGGVRLESLDDDLMARAAPGVFCAGEMLDWEAPTGGYLLTACMASGRRAGAGVLRWLEAR